MALGKWITNMSDPCALFMLCGICTYCDQVANPTWWQDKEIGPARLLSNGQAPSKISGVYEKVPGPAGYFGIGYAAPPPITPMPPLFAPTYGYTTTPTAAPAANISSTVQRLRAIFAEIGDLPKTEKFDPRALLEPMGCKACGSQEKNKHKLMCPCDPARSKPDGS